jgi:hypothetical protein
MNKFHVDIAVSISGRPTENMRLIKVDGKWELGTVQPDINDCETYDSLEDALLGLAECLVEMEARKDE